jgi:hypothetical protein
MPQAMTPGRLVSVALRDNVIPGEAQVLGRGWVAWQEADLAYRAVVSRESERMRWRAFVGDARLGPAMKAYGGMSIPLDPVADDLGWPSGTRLAPEVTTALQMFFRDARSLVHSRRELAELMMKRDDLRYGDVVAWLPAGGWPGRLAQALMIATDMDNHALAATIRELINVPGSRVVSRRPRHRRDETLAERDRLDALYLDRDDLEQDIRREVETWLKRYATLSDRPLRL